MPRYIDAEALTAEFKRLKLGENSLIERLFADGVYAVIDTFPTADVVEVVCCKDCLYWEKGKDYEPYCNHYGNMMTDTNADDFCSYGARKDGEVE